MTKPRQKVTVNCPLCGDKHVLKVHISELVKTWGRIAFRCPKKDMITDVALSETTYKEVTDVEVKT